MMEPPPPDAMIGMTWRDIRNMDFTFTAMTRSQSVSLSSTTEARRIMPALLNRIWMPPNSRTARSMMRWQSAARVTSPGSKMARPPCLVISAATACPPDSLMSVRTTEARSLAKRKAVVRPMPDAAPVMIAILP